MGINGDLMRVVHNLYQNAKACIKKSNVVSNSFQVNVGVRQGENLSPLLFAIFLNDFELFISKCYDGLSAVSEEAKRFLSDEDREVFLRLFSLLYADDTIVLAESAEQLQLALSAVYEYCRIWNLTVNVDKTKIVIFSKKKTTEYPAFLFGHRNIQVVDHYVYLGVIFNFNGSFQKAIDKQVTQGRKAFYSLLNKIRKLHLPIDISIELFNQLVTPVLLYGCEIWGFSNLEQIEVLYRKFIKTILYVKYSTPNCMIYGETGTMPIINSVITRMLTFYARLINGKPNKLSAMMSWMYNLIRKKHCSPDNYYSDWMHCIENSLGHLGMYDLWVYQGNGFPTEFIKNSVKRRVYDMYIQEWRADTQMHDFCDSYLNFKGNYGFEKYLTELTFYQRLVLTKWRLRSNNLPISKCRFILNDNVICPFCPECIGDEIHYLFNCSFFQTR